MIGNRYSHGETGFTILEEGDMDRQTLQLRVRHYLICRPDGEALPDTFPDLDAARREIDRVEAETRRP